MAMARGNIDLQLAPWLLAVHAAPHGLPGGVHGGCTARVRWALCVCSVGSCERGRVEWHLGPDIR